MMAKILLPLLALTMLAGCATRPTTLNIAPSIVLPQQDTSLMGVTVSINGADQRQDPALAKVNRDGQLVTLTASRDIRFLLQETLEKQMVARGYMVGANSSVSLQIIVNSLFADVQEGNLRFEVTTRADISIIARAGNGSQQIKNYRASHSIQGPFTASNARIAETVNSVLSDVINEMAQDTSISQFIKQNSR